VYTSAYVPILYRFRAMRHTGPTSDFSNPASQLVSGAPLRCDPNFINLWCDKTRASSALMTHSAVWLQQYWYPVYTIQPVVKPDVQPVWQQVVSCKRGLSRLHLLNARLMLLNVPSIVHSTQ